MNVLEQRVLHGLAAEWRVAYAGLPWTCRGRMRQPGFELREMGKVWGVWEASRKNIALSRDLAFSYPWKSVREVLLHEMAHQIADEILGGDSTPHALRFQEACRMIGADPKASASFPSIYERMAREGGEENDRVMLRVRKLLALAQSSNRHEAEVAMMKAHEVMARHNVDLVSDHGHRAYCSITVGEVAARQTVDRYALAALLRAFYFVETVWIEMFVLQNGKLGRVLEISGTQENVKMADYVHAFLNRAIEEQWAVYDLGKKAGKLRKTDFALGLIEGFREKLETCDRTMKASGGPSMALVQFEDRHLKAYLKERHPRLRRIGGRGRCMDEDAHGAGRKAGRSTILHKPVESKSGGAVRMLDEARTS